jgi:predicted HicB family RNase H-like nuclease
MTGKEPLKLATGKSMLLLAPEEHAGTLTAEQAISMSLKQWAAMVFQAPAHA